jgi:HSP20 family molecular chaperone IbpA
MKKLSVLMLVALFAATTMTIGCFSKRQAAKASPAPEGERKTDDAEFTAREEITKTVQLPANATVGVYSIDGSIEVTTSDTDKAEIHILRLARTKDTFEKQKAEIRVKDNELKIYGNRRDREFGIWDHITGDDEVRTRVTLKLPRKIEFHTWRVNGQITLGEIEGRVEAGNINGKLIIAKAVGSADFNNINGKVEAGIANLNKDGIEVHQINGNVDLKFLDEANVNVEAHGLNGRVNAEVPNVNVEKQERQYYRAKIGTGGPEISIGRMNGNLTLLRAGQMAKVEKQTAPEASPDANKKRVVDKIAKELHAR